MLYVLNDNTWLSTMIQPHISKDPGRILRQEREFYDRRWRTSAITPQELPPQELRRAAATTEAIPSGCGSVLDVGAEDGLVSREIYARGCRVVVLDLSHVVLRTMSVPERCCGSADQLPFPDRVFDLVLSTEMLEPISCLSRILMQPS